MYDLNGKVVLITGGASGIGFACTKEILRSGVQGITIADINLVHGEAAEKELTKEFGSNRVIFVKTDVTKKDQLEEAFKATLNKWKTIDIFINNAGTFNDKQWEFQISLNVVALVNGNLLALDNMSREKGGKGGIILNVCSILGLQETTTLPIFAGTKHFIIGFSRSLGTPYHFDKTGVRIVTICPGYTKTPLSDDMSLSGERFLSPDLYKLYAEEVKTLSKMKQSAESVAEGVVTCIREGKNGSVWIAENNEHYEIELPSRQTLRKK